MTRHQISTYYDATAESETREELKFSVGICEAPKIAIDCGCGAGSDIAFLLAHGFKVHAFDIEEDSISRCKARFKGNPDLKLYQAGFDTFDYPEASLVLADASLFFCQPNKFDEVWDNICRSLGNTGVFCGSFLGLEDSMARDDYNKDEIWPDVLAFDEEQVKNCFSQFEILRFNEHRSSGETPQGTPHHWHIYSVVARKTS